MEGNIITVALAGHPGTGKSDIFRRLSTRILDERGSASFPVPRGRCAYREQEYLLLDLPEILSLTPHSPAETVTAQFLSSGRADIFVVVCSALCLERGLKLLSAILHLPSINEQACPVILCINFCSEAEKRGIQIDYDLLEDVLQIPVIPCLGSSVSDIDDIKAALFGAWKHLFSYECLDFSPKQLARETTSWTAGNPWQRENTVDSVLVSPMLGRCLICFIFLFVFWLSILGSCSLSLFLWKPLVWLEDGLSAVLSASALPSWLIQCLIDGIYRTLAWIMAFTLPPAVLMLPLFILLEESGVFPRMAFLSDHHFVRCGSCGRQCPAMLMGLGCHTAGIRYGAAIASPKERLAAALGSTAMPCAGRIPVFFVLAMLFSMKFSVHGSGQYPQAALAAAVYMLFILLFGMAASFGLAFALSSLFLRRLPSRITLELPPLVLPRITRSFICTIIDQILVFTGKTAAFAVPAGLLLWLSAHTAYFGLNLGTPGLLGKLCTVLQPLGTRMGIDGSILAALLFSLPVNELLFPFLLMTSQPAGNPAILCQPYALTRWLLAHGWNGQTLLSMTVLMLFHPPCLPVLSAIKKETGAQTWCIVSFFLPALSGMGLCMVLTWINSLLFC